MDEEDEGGNGRLLVALAAGVVLLLVLPAITLTAAVIFTVATVSTFGAAAEEMQCSRAMPWDNVSQDVSAGGGKVRLPVTGKFTYTSTFGNRLHPIEGVMKPHNGIDLVTNPSGGDVVAFQSGKVASVVQGDPGAGNFIVLEHGGGISSRYLHLASTSVKKGQSVKAGTKIGVEGTTGGSTGNHLHFEILKDGTATDPVPYLKQQGVALPKLQGQGDASKSSSSKNKAPAGPGSKYKRASNSSPSPSSTSSEPSASRTDMPAPGRHRSRSAPSSSSSASPSSKGKQISANGSVGKWSAAQVSVAKEIVDRGKERGVDDWTITVAVMTAMAESSLKNLDHGDAVRADTVGVFQEGPERGPLSERKDPAGAADIFWDHLEKVPGYRELSPTIAAHRAQANADPWHYQPHWNDAVRVVAAIKGNPDLVTKYAGSGGSSDCSGGGGDSESVPAMAGGKDLPDPPGMKCPASDNPAEKGLQPTARRGLRCTAHAFPEVKTMHGVGERAGPSDHGSGLAVDFMIENYRSKEGRASGWRIAEWARKNADKLDVQYVIWDQKIWNADRDDEGWRPMEDRGSDTENHLDHPHLSFR